MNEIWLLLHRSFSKHDGTLLKPRLHRNVCGTEPSTSKCAENALLRFYGTTDVKLSTLEPILYHPGFTAF